MQAASYEPVRKVLTDYNHSPGMGAPLHGCTVFLQAVEGIRRRSRNASLTAIGIFVSP